MSTNYEGPRYFNRELSWLAFDQRVLEEATDPTNPLLERLKFLAITASNLDEFFRVRVGGLQLMIQQGVTRPDPSGMSTQQQLDAIGVKVRELIAKLYDCFCNDIEPKLAAEGIIRVTIDQLSPAQRRAARKAFETEIHPILTPMAVSLEEEFPLLPNQSLAVCVRLLPQQGNSEPNDRFAVIPFGPFAPRIIPLPATSGLTYLLLEELVRLFADRFFPGESIAEVVPFRITRNADISLQEDSAGDLLDEMERVLEDRREADCVRLEIATGASSELLAFLSQALRIDEPNVYQMPGPVDMVAYFRVADRAGFDHLKNPSWPPQNSPSVPSDQSLFETISQQDVMLYHPYESFEPVVRFLHEAANDPDVLAIKQTLYRTSQDSQIVAALKRAVFQGKHVTVLVELKARFDEARNIHWARQLEEAGAQVIYGVKGLKTHAKCCLVIRREPQGIQRYMHFGTGNYNESTSRLYCDVSLMTCNPDLGADAVSFFNAITGYSQPQRYRRLEAAPLGLRDKLLDLIQVETDRARQGLPAKIHCKLNSLVDPTLIDAFYLASQAGVQIGLNIRGICCLRPGIAGLSENIEVVSIVDRFLEHARILYFYHGGDARVFIGSADWMPRNLDRRIELLIPVDDPVHQARLLHILELCMSDNVKGRRIRKDGTHKRLTPGKGRRGRAIRSQQVLFEETVEAVRESTRRRRTVFEPHLPPEDPSQMSPSS
ncbi:MAG: polyphosphate kinase 1 [Planctomycetaceae bacterium]